MNWSALSADDFEALCFNFLPRCGFVNTAHYGGSGDRARNIVAQYPLLTFRKMFAI
jgi:hypothetical protein